MRPLPRFLHTCTTERELNLKQMKKNAAQQQHPSGNNNTHINVPNATMFDTLPLEEEDAIKASIIHMITNNNNAMFDLPLRPTLHLLMKSATIITHATSIQIWQSHTNGANVFSIPFIDKITNEIHSKLHNLGNSTTQQGVPTDKVTKGTITLNIIKLTSMKSVKQMKQNN